MDRDVFILSAVTAAGPVEAMGLATENTGFNPARVQDAIFGLESSSPFPNVEPFVRAAGLVCPAVAVSPGLRAVFFAAQSILSGDLDIALVAGLGENVSTVLMLVSPEAVGRYNLLPRGRLAVRSLAGIDQALRTAGLASEDIAIFKTGEGGIPAVKELLEDLERSQAQWGMLASGSSALLVERI